MAQSLFQPVKLEPLAWEWNPGATFARAYNDAQENKRLNEKAELDSWMTRTLFPLKEQQAKLELEKLQQEVERSTLLTQKIREGNVVAHRGIMQGIQSIGQTTPSSQWNTTVRVKKTSSSGGVSAQMIRDVDSQIALPEEDEEMLVPPNPLNP